MCALVEQIHCTIEAIQPFANFAFKAKQVFPCWVAKHLDFLSTLLKFLPI